jgi:hypothetical protein
VLPHLSVDGEPVDMEIELSAPALPYRIDIYIGGGLGNHDIHLITNSVF